MTKISRKARIGLIVLTAVVLLIFGGVTAVYKGYILLNHPSRVKYPIAGVDLSHYQGSVDWEVLAQEKIRFAYIKATEGSGHVDECFAYNWENSASTDLKVGAYHFFSFDSPGETQAENFINNVKGRSGMLPPTVDVEYYGDKEINAPEAEQVRRELQIFLDAIQEQYGMVPVIYSTEEFWETYLKGYFHKYPLWIRNVYTSPGIDATWTFWQYTNRGRLQGYSGEEQFIDLNVFNGKESTWSAWGGD